MTQPDSVNRDGPLKGIRVLDLSRVLAGPFCTMVLGDLGAEIIKVEDCDAGDQTRALPPFANGLSHYFLAINRNKKSIALNLKSDEGRDIFLRLAGSADVVIENFRPGVMDSLRLSIDDLRRANPRLIVCSISGFGQTGAMRDVPAFDIITQALSGVMSINGEEGGKPLRLGIPLGDIGSGLWALIGILASLQHRNATGGVLAVDISMLESLMSLLGYLSQLYWFTGNSPVSAGNGHHSASPYGCYEVKDGAIVLAALNQRFFENFARACNRSNLIDDPRFRTPASRSENRPALEGIVRELLRSRTKAEWVRVFEDSDVPCAEVNSVGEALNQSIVVDRGFIQSVTHPTVGDLKVMGCPVNFGQAFGRGGHARPPEHGEHTVSILAGLGLGLEEVAELERAGVVRACAQVP